MPHDKLTADGVRFYKELKELKKLRVRVGFQDDGTSSGGDEFGLVDKAIANELGTETSPARPFIAQSVDRNEDKIRAFCQTKVKGITKGKTARDILNSIGVMQKALIQSSITDGDFAPNAPYTIAKKGSDHPLIDTGHMRQSVNYVITDEDYD